MRQNFIVVNSTFIQSQAYGVVCRNFSWVPDNRDAEGVEGEG